MSRVLKSPGKGFKVATPSKKARDLDESDEMSLQITSSGFQSIKRP